MRPLEILVNSGRKQPRDKPAIVDLHMTEFKQESGGRASAGSASWTQGPHGDAPVTGGSRDAARKHDGSSAGSVTPKHTPKVGPSPEKFVLRYTDAIL